jgi:hypothetical protein
LKDLPEGARANSCLPKGRTEQWLCRYTAALVHGQDLSKWHAKPDGKKKADANRKESVTIFSAKQRAAARMAKTVRHAAAACGQQVPTTVKNKDLRFANQRELQRFLQSLVEVQDGTRLPVSRYSSINSRTVLKVVAMISRSRKIRAELH